MTRCGCGSSCSCLIIESDSLIITGDGDQTSGYKGDLRLDPASPSPLVITPAGLSVNGTLPDLTGAITATAGSSVTAFGTENLPTANLNSGTDASSSTYWRGDGTWAIPPGSGGGSIPSLTGAINYTSGTTTTSFGTDSLPTANLNSGTGASAYTYWRGDGTWSVPGGAALSAYSAGALSGLSGNSVSSWTINIGGITGVQDVAIFKNPAGESQAYTGTAGVSLSFVIGGAPGTVGHSRTDALVIYKDPLGTPAYQVVAGTSATTGTQVPPNDATIRGAIPSGSLKFVTVVGYVTIAYGASSVSLGNLSRCLAGSLATPAVVANITERGYLPLIAGLKCYQVDNAMEQICDGTSWNNISRLLKKVTLTTAGDTISVTGIPLRDNLQMKGFFKNSGIIKPEMRLNNDSGANYSAQLSASGAAWTVITSQTTMSINPSPGAEAYSCFVKTEINNPLGDFKVTKTDSYDQYGTNATTSLNFAEYRGKWASTVQVTRVDVINTGSGDFAIGSYVEIWG